MLGNLIYLYAVTLEDKRLHITACTRGFYVNQSTDEEFNHKPANPNHLSHSLIELLSQVSPTFKRNFILLQRKRTQRHPFERVATPYQVRFVIFTLTIPLLGLATKMKKMIAYCLLYMCIPRSPHLLSTRLMPSGLRTHFRPNLAMMSIYPDRRVTGMKSCKLQGSCPERICRSDSLRERAIFKVYLSVVIFTERL